MNTPGKAWVAGILLLLGSLSSRAEIMQQVIEYQDGSTPLRGHLVWDSAHTTPRPGVLVVHEWWGLNDYAIERARQLARLGYVAFAVDMYGDKKVTTHGKQAKAWMTQITANIEQWRQRAALGLEVLKGSSRVDPDKLAAIGYCFGGATVMQMAYGNLGLDGVVSFHGSLPALQDPKPGSVTTSILVAHGEADGFIPAEKIDKFTTALNQAEADWQMIRYSGARHGFTNPGADQYGIDNVRYDARSDQRSWDHMRLFLGEVFTD